MKKPPCVKPQSQQPPARAGMQLSHVPGDVVQLLDPVLSGVEQPPVPIPVPADMQQAPGDEPLPALDPVPFGVTLCFCYS